MDRILKNPITWIAILIIVGGGGYVAVSPQTRGLRNKNPGNIRHNPANNWQGQTGQDDAGFVVFDSYASGVRAMGKVLDSYRRRGVDRLSSIVQTWAPSSENDTHAYVASVVRQTGLDASTIIGREHYPALVAAIIRHENGVNPFTESRINRWLGPSITAIL